MCRDDQSVFHIVELSRKRNKDYMYNLFTDIVPRGFHDTIDVYGKTVCFTSDESLVAEVRQLLIDNNIKFLYIDVEYGW